jgi:hypothetical protein
MRLGSQTNSVINHLLSRATVGQPVPTIGMGATLLGWTDRAPATIVGVFKATQMIRVQEDNYRRVDKNGMSECQTYEYSPNPEGYVHTFRRNKHGAWEEVAFNPATNRYKKTGGHGLRIGDREKYHDFSF